MCGSGGRVSNRDDVSGTEHALYGVLEPPHMDLALITATGAVMQHMDEMYEARNPSLSTCLTSIHYHRSYASVSTGAYHRHSEDRTWYQS